LFRTPLRCGSRVFVGPSFYKPLVIGWLSPLRIHTNSSEQFRSISPFAKILIYSCVRDEAWWFPRGLSKRMSPFVEINFALLLPFVSCFLN
jgi:hypothetical protein